MSLIGKEIAAFKAKAYKKGQYLDVEKADFMGHWSVLCFYPADFSVVCPTELADLQEKYDALKDLNTEIYACSTDTHEMHKKWIEKTPELRNVAYMMIGDPEHTLAKLFDVLDERDGRAQRGTFVIDPEGVVQSIEISANSIGRKAAVLIEKVKAAQYVAAHPGEACPAQWHEGGETVFTTLDLEGKI